ncbi:MAG TPA: NTP transferase domain-containing protein [Jiangellaceae bacterium]|nr:NTP transferase domain-containing protein [Jiangellaceae bacterium]
MIMGKGGSSGVWAAVVLAGGRGRRLGGVDKAALQVGDRSLLDTALAACSGAARTVVVGPTRPTGPAVRWALESPPGSGPVAALSAGIAELSAEVGVVVVLAADLPAVDVATVGRLLEAVDVATADGVALVDGTGRVQPLLAAYRLPALRRALNEVGDGRDLPVRRLLDYLTLATIPDQDGAATDIDTPQDLARWTRRHPDPPVDHGEVGHPGGSSPPFRRDQRGSGQVVVDERETNVIEEWVQALCEAMGVPPDEVDVAAVLDLAREAAHSVDRPAAPITTYVVGYAAAQRGGGAEAVATATAEAATLARNWTWPPGT